MPMCTSTIACGMASQIVGNRASLCGSLTYMAIMLIPYATDTGGREMLTLRKEPLFDCHTVAVMKNDLLVGHIPDLFVELSLISWRRMVTVTFTMSPEKV